MEINKERKVLVLFSGGLDSSVVVALYANLGYDVDILYVDYGNINAITEKAKVQALCNKFSIYPSHIHVINQNLFWSKGGCIDKDTQSTYVEMRNLIFISLATSMAESLDIDLVATGFIKAPAPYKDASEEFLFDINEVTSNSAGISITAPLMLLDKQGVYRLGKKLGINLKDTFSCNKSSNSKPCGVCPDCLDI